MHASQLTRLLAAGGMTAAALLAAAGPASAADRDGRCDTGEFCYYYNSGNAGLDLGLPELGARLRHQPAGLLRVQGRRRRKGKCVKNQAASVWNRRLGR